MVGRIDSNFGLVFIVDQIEFNKTRWSCPWNNDQNWTQNSAGGGGVQGEPTQILGLVFIID